jgi:putative ABC transport system substrate-binding protein
MFSQPPMNDGRPRTAPCSSTPHLRYQQQKMAHRLVSIRQLTEHIEASLEGSGSGEIMRRREFIGVLGSVAAAWPLAARAQQKTGPRKVGILFPGELGAQRERLIAEGLSNELGDEKVVSVMRSSKGDDQLLGKYAVELAADVEVVLAIGSVSLVAARQASKTLPIVAVDLESDPIANGAAQSLNRPGGNITGIFLDAPEIAGKWIQIIREVLPQIRKVALLYDSHLDQTQLRSGEDTARKLGIETLRFGIDQPSEFRSAFERAIDAKVDAMLVHSSPIFVDQASAIAELSREFRLPSIGLFPIYAKVGGLVSYGPNNFELIRQAGGIAGKILRGAKPAEFPIQRPIYLSFLINMQTAKLLQLTIPASLAALADEVIE